MIELSDFGSWTQKIRNDYSKNSREWINEGGWFLVVEKESVLYDNLGDFHHKHNRKMVCLELYNPKELYWTFIRVFADTGLPEDKDLKLLNHIPAL